MLAIVKVQGGEENEKLVGKILEGLPNPVDGESTTFVMLPWFAEFTELPRELIKGLVESLTEYLEETR